MHRAELLRDCRYFNFKGLEQRLIPHAVSFNLARGCEEAVVRLTEILKSGISVAREPTAADPFLAWVNYARPFVGDKACELVLQIGDESTRLRFGEPPSGPGGGGVVSARAEFTGEMRTRVTKLFEVIATKLSLPPTGPLGMLRVHGGASDASPAPENTPLSEDLVKVVLDSASSVVLDGKPWSSGSEEEDEMSWMGGNPDPEGMSRKRRRVEDQGGMEEWVVRTGQWRLRIQGARNAKAAVECCLVAVKLDAYRSERARNAQRSFLGG